MGRPRKSVRPASFSIDAKMYKLLQELSDLEKKPMSHFVNMALYEYKPIRELDSFNCSSVKFIIQAPIVFDESVLWTDHVIQAPIVFDESVFQ